MVWKVQEFDKYYLNIFTMKEMGKDGRIYSKGSAYLSLYFRAKKVGEIGFYDEVPVRKNDASGKFPVLNFHLKILSDILNTLRYEKPLYIQININNLSGAVGTSAEPIGELEP